MPQRIARLRRSSAVSLVTAGALVAAGAAATMTSAVATGSPAPTAPAAGGPPSNSNDYVNYVAARVERPTGSDATDRFNGKLSPALARAKAIDRKYARGNPKAARQLAKREAEALRTDISPKEQVRAQNAKAKQTPTQTAKLLTLLVEFNPNAQDDFSGFVRPATVSGDRTCVTEPQGTLLSGPLHNQLPNPAKAEHKDNFTFWVPDFSKDHYEKLIYSKQGLTQRVRKDLVGPDGKPGVNLRGYTVANMYREMSRGAYELTGDAVGWITVPHSEAYYGASVCNNPDTDAPQDNSGHPDNPRDVQQLAVDAIDVLAAQDPNFAWDDYDIEDAGDADGDGNLREPDGVIDHLVLIHAGADKADDGGAQGTYSIWSHAGNIDPSAGGYVIPGTTKKISNYIMQAEDAGVGVVAHEYGHDLGLPDLYDTTGAGDSDVDYWDLMAAGSHTGPLFQTIPTHMGLWDKWVLGWVDPEVVGQGSRARTVTVGQASRPPAGTADGVQVRLPKKVVKLGDPRSGANMWWSGRDQNWADVRLTRTLDVPAAADLKFWMWNNYVIEADWDYGFVEVSTDGGTTWAPQKVYAEDGTLVSTDDGYNDPNGRLRDYGGLKYGLTGDTGGWRHDYLDLDAYAGQTISVRLRYATDAAYEERGWFADDFALTTGSTVVWSDDVENGTNGWTPLVTSFTDTSGTGWTLFSGTAINEQYYLAEWRNFDGFDKGLKYAYDTAYSNDGQTKVTRMPYNAPGLLVWYRDSTYSQNDILNHLSDLPSYGSKGTLLVVDSHFDPLRRTGAAAAKDPSTLKNLPSRAQASNAAFGLRPTYPFRECLEDPAKPFSQYCTAFGALPPVSAFTDAKGWYPGMELRGEDLFHRDADASTVIPSRRMLPYTTRIVDANGQPIRSLYGTEVAPGLVLGSGNPKDSGVELGVQIKVLRAGAGNQSATIWVHAVR